MNRSEQLSAGYKETFVLSKDLRGLRCFETPTADDAKPDEIYQVSIPSLNPDECIVPDTLALSFVFENSNTKSWFLNNLGRLLIDRLEINVQGKLVYQNTGESILEVYKDLWRWSPKITVKTVKNMELPTRMSENLFLKMIVLTNQQKQT